MKTTYKIILIALISFFYSCEDVIDVDLKPGTPQLVIDANLVWDKNTTGNEQIIRITKTADYFNNQTISVSGAVVNVKNSSNTTFEFIEENPNTGIYVCTTFAPEVNETYTLTISAEGQTYTAIEKVYPTPDIKRTESRERNLFTNSVIEIKSFFDDIVGVNNYYLFSVKTPSQKFTEYDVLDDSFSADNELFGLYFDNPEEEKDKIKENDVVQIRHASISRSYNEYLKILLSIAGGSGGGPFSTPPSSVRGNITNISNNTKNPLGYFSIIHLNVIEYNVIITKE